MPSPDNVQFYPYLDDLAERTRRREIDWREANPTTFIWDTQHESKQARFSVQRVERTIQVQPGGPLAAQKEYNYIFQAFELAKNGQYVARITLSGLNEPELNPKLALLFDLVRAEITNRALEFLKEFLPGQ
jgi:hypothetical protein